MATGNRSIELSAEEAVSELQKGKLVIFPTETFFGVAALPFHEQGVESLLALKKREQGQGLPLIASTFDDLQSIVDEIPSERLERTRSLIELYWPGPLTLVLAASSSKDRIHPGVFGPECSLAIRVSSHVGATAFAKAAGGLLTSTSANPHGKPPAKASTQVRDYFPELSILSGDCLAETLPSTILDVRSFPFTVLREGAVPSAQLSGFI